MNSFPLKADKLTLRPQGGGFHFLKTTPCKVVFCYALFKFFWTSFFSVLHCRHWAPSPNPETTAHGFLSTNSPEFADLAVASREPAMPAFITQPRIAEGTRAQHYAAAHGERLQLFVRAGEGRSMKQIDYLEFTSLMESFGITDRRFLAPLFQQLVEADGSGGDGVEFAAAVVLGIKPEDYVVAMHAAQMAAMHRVTMKQMGRVSNSRGTLDQEVAVAMATKLARTFTAQMEALKRYRTGGEQKVTVRHVSVGDGGQAIVGSSITHNALEESAENKLPALTNASQPAMPIIEQPERVPVPVRRQKKNERSST